MRGDGTLYIVGPPGPEGLNLLTETSSSNVYLDNLVVDGYTLSPAFEATTTDYTVNVPDEVYSVDIIATVTDATVNLKVYGEVVSSGIPKTVDISDVGNNTVKVEVIAQDGMTVNTYTITIKRVERQNLRRIVTLI